MNIFFVHTPFQLLVAQNLIDKKKLSGNVLVLSHTGTLAQRFRECFELIKVAEFWEHVDDIGNLSDGVFNSNNIAASLVGFYEFNKKVTILMREYSFDSIYFGDINHPAYQFLAYKYEGHCNLIFFEEGLSHYVPGLGLPAPGNNFAQKAKGFCLDVFLYRPLGGKGFSKKFKDSKDGYIGFEVSKRYSILPGHYESYDELLEFDFLISPGLEGIISKEIRVINAKGMKKNALYLSSSTTTWFDSPYRDETAILQSAICESKSENCSLLIKFHPKDDLEKIKRIMAYLDSSQLEYHIVFDDLSLPVELIFNRVAISRVYGIDSSSLLYAREFIPGVSVKYLLPDLLAIYEISNVRSEILEYEWSRIESANSKVSHKLSQVS